MNRKTKLITLCILYILLSFFAVVIIVLPSIRKSSDEETMASAEEVWEEITTESETMEESNEEEPNTVIEETFSEAIIKEEPETNFPIEFTNKTKSNVHIRKEASIEGTIIGKIPPGKKGLITDFINNEWAMVSYNELKGYSAYRYFLYDSTQNKLENTPESDENILPTETIQEETTLDIVTIINNCYIRSSTNSHTMENVIDIAKKGNTYPHDIKNDTDYWCCILLSDGRLGFVSRGFTDCP